MKAAARVTIGVSLLAAVLLAVFIPVDKTWATALGSTDLARLLLGVVSFVVGCLLGAFVARTVRDGFPDNMAAAGVQAGWTGGPADIEKRISSLEELAETRGELIVRLTEVVTRLRVDIEDLKSPPLPFGSDSKGANSDA